MRVGVKRLLGGLAVAVQGLLHGRIPVAAGGGRCALAQLGLESFEALLLLALLLGGGLLLRHDDHLPSLAASTRCLRMVAVLACSQGSAGAGRWRLRRRTGGCGSWARRARARDSGLSSPVTGHPVAVAVQGPPVAGVARAQRAGR